MSNLGKRAREEEEFPAWEAQQAMSVAAMAQSDAHSNLPENLEDAQDFTNFQDYDNAWTSAIDPTQFDLYPTQMTAEPSAKRRKTAPSEGQILHLSPEVVAGQAGSTSTSTLPPSQAPQPTEVQVQLTPDPNVVTLPAPQAVATSHAAVPSSSSNSPTPPVPAHMQPRGATNSAGLEAARRHLSSQKWCGIPLTFVLDVDALFTELRAAADDFTHVMDKAAITNRFFAKDGKPAKITSEQIDIACYTTINHEIRVHTPEIGTTMEGKSGPTTDLKDGMAERLHTFTERHGFICQTFHESKKTIQDIIDRPHDVQRLVVLAPVSSLKVRNTNAKGNDQKAEDMSELKSSAQTPATTTTATAAGPAIPAVNGPSTVAPAPTPAQITGQTGTNVEKKQRRVRPGHKLVNAAPNSGSASSAATSTAATPMATPSGTAGLPAPAVQHLAQPGRRAPAQAARTSAQATLAPTPSARAPTAVQTSAGPSSSSGPAPTSVPAGPSHHIHPPPLPQPFPVTNYTPVSAANGNVHRPFIYNHTQGPITYQATPTYYMPAAQGHGPQGTARYLPHARSSMHPAPHHFMPAAQGTAPPAAPRVSQQTSTPRPNPAMYNNMYNAPNTQHTSAMPSGSYTTSPTYSTPSTMAHNAAQTNDGVHGNAGLNGGVSNTDQFWAQFGVYSGFPQDSHHTTPQPADTNADLAEEEQDK